MYHSGIQFSTLFSLYFTGHRQHDGWQGRLRPVPGRRQLHADGQPGAQEARLSVSDELRQIAARYGHHGGQHFR